MQNVIEGTAFVHQNKTQEIKSEVRCEHNWANKQPQALIKFIDIFIIKAEAWML
jgi:hypothetical protein